MKKLFKSKLILQIAMACAVATLVTAGIVGATTTIGTDILTAGTLGAATTTIASGNLVVDTDTLFVDYLNDKVGIGTTTPYSRLSIWGDGADPIFEAVDSASSTKMIILDSGNVGIGSTTPTATLAIGSDTDATSTIDFAKPCFRMRDEQGTTVYYYPSDQATLGGWATSTTSCF